MMGCCRRVVSFPVSNPVARGSGGLFSTQKDMPNKTVMVRIRSGGIRKLFMNGGGGLGPRLNVTGTALRASERL